MTQKVLPHHAASSPANVSKFYIIVRLRKNILGHADGPNDKENHANFYFFQNDSDFLQRDRRLVVHVYPYGYGLTRNVTVYRKYHGYTERFRLAHVHFGLLNAYGQLKGSLISR